MQGDENDLNKVQEGHNDRVYKLYDDKSKNFQRAFSLLIGFALIFLFIIFFPYVSLQEINQQLINTSQEINQTNATIKTYQRAQDGIQMLTNEINEGPADLQSFILGINNITSQSNGSITIPPPTATVSN